MRESYSGALGATMSGCATRATKSYTPKCSFLFNYKKLVQIFQRREAHQNPDCAKRAPCFQADRLPHRIQACPPLLTALDKNEPASGFDNRRDIRNCAVSFLSTGEVNETAFRERDVEQTKLFRTEREHILNLKTNI